MTKIFDIDWKKLMRLNVPAALQTPVVLQLLWSAVKEVEKIHQRFMTYRTDWLYKQQHTSQLAHIEKVLNDHFDSVERRIYIHNVTFESYIYLYPDGEAPHFLQEDGAIPNQPLHLLDSDAGTISPDATVYVPLVLRPSSAIATDNFENEMKGKIDFYKTYGVNYQIIYYE